MELMGFSWKHFVYILIRSVLKTSFESWFTDVKENNLMLETKIKLQRQNKIIVEAMMDNFEY